MRTALEGDKLVLYPEGRIDSANAASVDAQIQSAIAAHPGAEPVMDAGGLEYISSAGLRVMLGISRELPEPLMIRNVSPEIYEVLEMTGFTSILRVRRALREISIEGCEEIGHGAVGKVYRLDRDTIVKVFREQDSLESIEREQILAKQAFLRGIPTAISYDVVKVGGRYGAVFEMLKADNLNDRLIRSPERFDELIVDYVRLMRTVHGVEMAKGEVPDARDIWRGYLDGLRGILPEDADRKVRALLDAMPENLHVVHGDIQMKNVMYSDGEPLLIDMETLCAGDPVFELAGPYITYIAYPEADPNETMDFLGLPNETAQAIYQRTVDQYLIGRTPEEKRLACERIELLGAVRFLNLVAVQHIGNPALTEIRTKDACAHIAELAGRVDRLELFA